MHTMVTPRPGPAPAAPTTIWNLARKTQTLSAPRCCRSLTLGNERTSVKGVRPFLHPHCLRHTRRAGCTRRNCSTVEKASSAARSDHHLFPSALASAFWPWLPFFVPASDISPGIPFLRLTNFEVSGVDSWEHRTMASLCSWKSRNRQRDTL